MRVLIVDDEEYVLKGICKAVSDMGFGFQIDSEMDPFKAEELIKNNYYDIIISDIRMEGEDGFEMIEKVKPYALNTKFVILSAYYDYEFMHRALQLGVDDYVLKPINKNSFKNCITKIKAEIEESSYYQEKIIHENENIEDLEKTTKENVDSKKISNAMAYIDNHFTEKLTLAYVANIVDLNYSYFSRVFKKKTGMTFQNYVTEKRMEHAIQLLDNHNLKIHEISCMLGYEDSRHFFRVFKKKFGVSPKKYRETK